MLMIVEATLRKQDGGKSFPVPSKRNTAAIKNPKYIPLLSERGKGGLIEIGPIHAFKGCRPSLLGWRPSLVALLKKAFTDLRCSLQRLGRPAVKKRIPRLRFATSQMS